MTNFDLTRRLWNSRVPEDDAGYTTGAAGKDRNMAETNGTANTCPGGTLKLEDLKRLEREIAAMPQPPWTLIAPDGRAWQDVDPQKLLRVLALACYPLMGTPGVVLPEQAASGVAVSDSKTFPDKTPMKGTKP